MYAIPSELLVKDDDGFYCVKDKQYKPINNEKKIQELSQGLFALRQLINTPSLVAALNKDLSTEYERKDVLRKIALEGIGKVHDEVNRIMNVRPEFIGTTYFRRLHELINDYTAVIMECEPTEKEYNEYMGIKPQASTG